MLEPTTQRITATVTEWHGTHGKALGDDGKTYDLQSDDNELSSYQIGDRLELYLDWDSQGVLEKLTFNHAPNSAGGLLRLSGERFYWQPEKTKRRLHRIIRHNLMKSAPVFIIYLLVAVLSDEDGFATLMLIGTIVFIIVGEISEIKYNDERNNDIAFILDEKGIMIAAHAISSKKDSDGNRRDLGIIWVFWDDIEKVEIQPTGFDQQTHLRFFINEVNIHHSRVVSDDATSYRGKDIWFDVRTDLLSDSDKIAIENTIRNEMEKRWTAFQAA